MYIYKRTDNGEFKVIWSFIQLVYNARWKSSWKITVMVEKKHFATYLSKSFPRYLPWLLGVTCERNINNKILKITFVIYILSVIGWWWPSLKMAARHGAEIYHELIVCNISFNMPSYGVWHDYHELYTKNISTIRYWMWPYIARNCSMAAILENGYHGW